MYLARSLRAYYLEGVLLIGGKISAVTEPELNLMRKGKHPSPPVLSSLALMILLVSPGAFAYLDPSTGSMVVSAIVGILASIALALKTYWYRIKAFLSRDDKQDSSAQQPPE